KTWPRWLPQLAQCTSVRVMPHLRSTDVATAPSTGSLKLGQPVPLSHFTTERNSGCPQPAQDNVPARFSCSSAQLPGGSVACPRITAYCSGESSARHSASVRVKGKPAAPASRVAPAVAVVVMSRLLLPPGTCRPLQPK